MLTSCKRQLKGTSGSQSYQHFMVKPTWVSYHNFLHIIIIYTFQCVFNSIWPMVFMRDKTHQNQSVPVPPLHSACCTSQQRGLSSHLLFINSSITWNNKGFTSVSNNPRVFIAMSCNTSVQDKENAWTELANSPKLKWLASKDSEIVLTSHHKFQLVASLQRIASL